VTFLSFVYPGLLPGNGPGFNAAGVVQTTNYIQPHRIADGIPRYFVGRAVLEAQTLAEAVDLVTVQPRAFSWHHNLASLDEGRILSVETVADPKPRHSVLEVDGLYIHTNHLLHDGMTGDGQAADRPYDVPYISSTTRLDVLTRALADHGPPTNVAEIMAMLTLHEGRPYSPCRHPEGEVEGITLGTAVFVAPNHTMKLYHGNPCGDFTKDYTLTD
jgi:hypothetical protein